MVPPKPALWAILLALLGMAPGQSGLRTCSVPDVLRHYRAVIFEDLQAAVRQAGPGAEWPGPGSPHLPFIHKNLTGAARPGWRGLGGAVCSAQKVRSPRPQSCPPGASPQGSPQPPLASLPSPGARYPTVYRVPGSDPAQGGGPGPPRGPGEGSVDRRHAHRGGDAAPLRDAEPAEPAAQDAPSPESPRPEAAPRARPGRRRHLLGETLRAAGGGPRGSLARVLRGPRSSRRGCGAWARASFAAERGPSLRWAPRGVPAPPAPRPALLRGPETWR
ncbi:uncharacterized protein C20orf204 homolog isoform X3 [Mustela lutreola]|uniref:uncharacterized protein C20orf204 homolog isoform X3 n=2 Tax=Mustela lutreola TaxID=9666 RepID=UPI002797576C|nr:uncharacterized protein C20orf204 homolog isoform X3 [Mustela lutreola]